MPRRITYWWILAMAMLAACAPGRATAVVNTAPVTQPTAGVPTSATGSTSTVNDLAARATPSVAASASSAPASGSRANCPITQPQNPIFIPPSPYSPTPTFAGHFWYGSDALWTDLLANGTWEALPYEAHEAAGYVQKVFWWRKGYISTTEQKPALTVTGRRLDAAATPLVASSATNASAADIGDAMLVGIDVPTLGCWEITGHYHGHELSFVVWVAP
jgi:hypothetical protein